MEGLKFQRIKNAEGQTTGINIHGNLVLDNSQFLKDELVDVINSVKELEISISDVEDIDVSCIQLFVAFITQMQKQKVKYNFTWSLNDDQRNLIESVGLSEELLVNVI